MNSRRAVLAIVLIGVGGFAAWRVLATTLADRFAAGDPERALQWDARHADAWSAIARRQLAAGDRTGAAASARRLLAIDPVQGRAFAVLAQASTDEDAVARARLYHLAGRRAPRDVAIHAWLADQALLAGQPAQTLSEIDAILRLTPRRAAVLVPHMARLAANPEFADALAAHLRTDPPWRSNMLATLSAQESPGAADRVFGRLRAQGALDPEETRRWLEAMLQAGRWNEAYGHWAGIVLATGQRRLPAVHNGGFEQPPSHLGFDWRLATTPGVYTETGPTEGASGTAAAHLHFLGRPVPRADLEQPLLLAAGPHRMSFRVRASGLRSTQGLRWTLNCADQPQGFAQGPAIDGDFDWRPLSMVFEVPPDCPGQWLRLINPAAPGSSQVVSGDLWLDDVRIVSVGASTP